MVTMAGRTEDGKGTNGGAPSPPQQQRCNHLTPDNIDLLTSLTALHTRRGTVALAVKCKQLLWRVVVEADVNVRGCGRYGGEDEDEDSGDNNNDRGGVRVIMKMYTVAMDAWAKSQRHPPFSFEGGGGVGGGRARDNGRGNSFSFKGEQHPQQ